MTQVVRIHDLPRQSEPARNRVLRRARDCPLDDGAGDGLARAGRKAPDGKLRVARHKLACHRADLRGNATHRAAAIHHTLRSAKATVAISVGQRDQCSLVRKILEKRRVLRPLSIHRRPDGLLFDRVAQAVKSGDRVIFLAQIRRAGIWITKRAGHGQEADAELIDREVLGAFVTPAARPDLKFVGPHLSLGVQPRNELVIQLGLGCVLATAGRTGTGEVRVNSSLDVFPHARRLDRRWRYTRIKRVVGRAIEDAHQRSFRTSIS